MATIIFEDKIDLLLSATPPPGGFIVAYDLDGILKQKDEFGIITPIGFSTIPALDEVLQIGNNTKQSHIILGTATSISSENGNSFLVLDEGTNQEWIKLKSNLGEISINNIVSGLSANSNVLISNGGNFYSSILGGTQSISSSKGIEIGLNSSDEISISDNSSDSYFSKANLKAPLMLSTQGSEVIQNISNSVVIGGVNILATESNTVYLGNKVNINNKYNLPSEVGLNGQYLKYNSSTNEATWSFITGITPSLTQVLEVGNTTGTHSIVMGTQSSIRSEYGDGSLFFSHLPTSVAISTDNGELKTSFLLVRDSDVFLKANDHLTITASTGLISTLDGHGFRYTDEYEFLDLSLITKQYVDTGTASIWIELDKKLEKRVYTIDLVEDVTYTLTHDLNTTDLHVEIYYNLEIIQIDLVQVIDAFNINLRSTRNLNDTKIILIAN